MVIEVQTYTSSLFGEVGLVIRWDSIDYSDFFAGTAEPWRMKWFRVWFDDTEWLP